MSSLLESFSSWCFNGTDSTAAGSVDNDNDDEGEAEDEDVLLRPLRFEPALFAFCCCCWARKAATSLFNTSSCNVIFSRRIERTNLASS